MAKISALENNVITLHDKSPSNQRKDGFNSLPKIINRHTGLSDAIKNVMGVLCSASMNSNSVSWSINRIAFEAGKEYKTTCRILNQIEKIGFITQQGKGATKQIPYRVYFNDMCYIDDETELAKLIEKGLASLNKKSVKPANSLKIETFSKTENPVNSLKNESNSLKSESMHLYNKQLFNNSLTISRNHEQPPPKPKKLKPVFSANSVEFTLSVLLFDLIRLKHPKARKPDFANWSKHVGYMLRLDNRTPDEIETVIRWCQQDNFWCSNIMSTKKLRDKFDQLWLKMGSKRHSQVTIEEKNHLAMLSAREKARQIYAGQGGV